MKKTMITAHSGCEGTEQDSLESVRRGIELRADAVEMDVRLDSQGILRISHNQEASQEGYNGRATLQQVFDLIKPAGVKINLDVKEGVCIPLILELAERNGLSKERLILSGAVGIEQLLRNPDWGAQARIYLNLEEILKYVLFREISSPEDFCLLVERPWKFIKAPVTDPAEYVPWIVYICRALPVAGLNAPQWILSAGVLAAMERERIPLSVWTVDDIAEQKRFLQAPPPCLENLTTRNVAAAIRIRGEQASAQTEQ